ncbi:FAD-dependent oxidoreductase [Neobacillus rhizophilus]|uniref:NAD(P)-binding protein n=1 Tax=Neobacillus rhizophilus TaxID=2833579 RepID=A0A942UA66_9BACI|nr:FAD-dependent oxidoreductase [Neobacillus rhizophilus]MBS4215043.1 NAD(P)-binding protein [Neobacillus rhizophilus]MBU8919199.1 NAD(P)-binding protein [Bacillus sp. FJAT-29953]
MKYDFIIAGGGIAGLTTAILLQKEGFRVKVLERTKELKEVGAGLGLGANAWKGLARLEMGIP